MNLTKRQRLAAYKWILKYLQDEEWITGLCLAVGKYGRHKGWRIPLYMFDFPELQAKQPKNLHSSYWWKKGNRKPRIRAVEKCIAELQTKKS